MTEIDQSDRNERHNDRAEVFFVMTACFLAAEEPIHKNFP